MSAESLHIGVHRPPLEYKKHSAFAMTGKTSTCIAWRSIPTISIFEYTTDREGDLE